MKNVKKIKMTFDEYDKTLEVFEEMKTPVIIPTYEQVEDFYNNPKKWLMFCCYILEKFPTTENASDKYIKKNIRNFVNEYLELVE